MAAGGSVTAVSATTVVVGGSIVVRVVVTTVGVGVYSLAWRKRVVQFREDPIIKNKKGNGAQKRRETTDRQKQILEGTHRGNVLQQH